MKTTKRSKMLLSSIAMLLVALVALGSATYAWYKTNTYVTADGVTVTASAPDGLKISQTGAPAYNSISFSPAVAETLRPSTLSASTTSPFYTGLTAYEAAAEDNYAASATTISTSTASDFVNTGTFTIGTTSNDDTTIAFKVNITGSTLTDSYVNIAIVDTTGYTGSTATPKVIGYWKSGTGTSHDAQAANYLATGVASSETTKVKANGSATINDYSTFAYVVWVDGTNEDCVTNSPNLSGVSFEIRADIA